MLTSIPVIKGPSKAKAVELPWWKELFPCASKVLLQLVVDYQLLSVVYDRTTNFTELPNRTELEKNYRTELYRTEPLPNYLLYRFQFFHYKKFSLCILARISVSICYKYGYVRSKNHTKFNFFKNRLKIFFVN